MSTAFEPTIRWPGCPPICVTANLPAFASPTDAATFRAANCPGGEVLAQWQCRACGQWHFWSCGPADGGGNHRAGETTLPRRIRELIERTRLC